ncbi:VC2046/SO_2500 family protein [Shewanella carassii]|uniref:QueD-like protein n=1 Tax=Shewanella carassii TaxID=1987584 RepID=A0ABQ1SVC8_9GAMM|nr:VC2046/SO_2500 family protein [Shewanella carassii]GGE66736.1 queD-like protein [Shewanella carassii]
MRTDVSLINELQLGGRLNQAVESHRRGEFALLLALMSQDVRDWPQFHLHDNVAKDAVLRQQFDLPAPQPLVGDLSQEPLPVDNSYHFISEGERSFQLAQALVPEPLVIRGKRDSGMQDALDNCDWHTRLRTEGALNQPKVALMEFVDQLSEQRRLAGIYQTA